MFERSLFWSSRLHDANSAALVASMLSFYFGVECLWSARRLAWHYEHNEHVCATTHSVTRCLLGKSLSYSKRVLCECWSRHRDRLPQGCLGYCKTSLKSTVNFFFETRFFLSIKRDVCVEHVNRSVG